MNILHIIIGILLTIFIIIIPYELIRKNEIRKKKRLQFALLAYQSHTNPHFIKNVLQAINWFILNNEKTLASDYLCDFSKLMEDILSFSKKYFVTLAEKLEFLDLYLKLQHLRHVDKFDYISLYNKDENKPTIYVAPEINPEVFILPPLIIHPYIENAIEHGLKPKKTKGKLSVKFEYVRNKLVCTIADNGIGIKASKAMQTAANIKRSNIGIINTQKRIDIIKKLYKINIRLNVSELYPGKEEPGTIVKLEFHMPIIFDPELGMPQEFYSA